MLELVSLKQKEISGAGEFGEARENMQSAPSDSKSESDRGSHIPTLRKLDELPGVTRVWYRLGLHLGVRADGLDTIEKNYPRDADLCKIKMFAEWLRSDTDPSYEKLVRVLAAVGERKLAESVCNTQGIPPYILDSTGAIKVDQSHAHNTTLECDAVTAEIVRLREEYKQLVIMTQEAVKVKSPTLDEFRTDITLELPESIRSELELSLMKKLQVICDAKSIDAIFCIFNLSIWSYLNFGLLQHIVKVYGDDELRQRMEMYTTSVESFQKQTTLEEFWRAQPAARECPKIPIELRESLKWITFKHGNLDSTTSLAEIEKHRKNLARRYSFPDFIIILADIEKGCITTTWLIPPSLAAKLADEINEGNVSFLEQHNILELTIQESTVYRSAQSTGGAIGDHSGPPTEESVPKISFSDLEFGDQLGEGAFGVVRRGHWKSRDVDVAIKRVPGKINKTESEILSKLSHVRTTGAREFQTVMAVAVADGARATIAEVMEEKDVFKGDIPEEQPFDPENLGEIRHSKRYFRCKGFAMFNSHPSCNRRWASGHAWCIMDLREQKIIHRFTQNCQKCEGLSEPEFDRAALRRMAEWAVDTHLRRTGRPSPIQRDLFDMADLHDVLDGPHDERRCAVCRQLGHSCWK